MILSIDPVTAMSGLDEGRIQDEEEELVLKGGSEDVTRPVHGERYLGDDTEGEDEDGNGLDEMEFLDEGIEGSFLGHSTQGGDRAKWWKVYALHFLFMWNTRMYEYASVLSPIVLSKLLLMENRLSW